MQDYKGWKAELSHCKSYNDLPQQLRTYLDAIEQETGVPIMAVSISPDRKDVLFK